MIKCSNDCIPVCDFCIYYDFNGDEYGAYIGKGYCRLHKKNCEPEDYCEDFHCFKM